MVDIYIANVDRVSENNNYLPVGKLLRVKK